MPCLGIKDPEPLRVAHLSPEGFLSGRHNALAVTLNWHVVFASCPGRYVLSVSSSDLRVPTESSRFQEGPW